MQEAYNSAIRFYCPSPAMPMPGLHNTASIGPIASIAAPVTAKIKSDLSIPASTKLVLITSGGVETAIPLEQWPKEEGIIWIAGWNAKITHSREDLLTLAQFNCSFPQLLASCDAVITKPGYGIVSESACNGIPALYVQRDNWAEERFLVDWWKQHNRVLPITRDAFFSGKILPELATLWHLEKPLAPQPHRHITGW